MMKLLDFKCFYFVLICFASGKNTITLDKLLYEINNYLKVKNRVIDLFDNNKDENFEITEILNCDFNENNETCGGLTNQVQITRALSIDSYSFTDVTSICMNIFMLKFRAKNLNL
jgi:hypothetical protein